MDTTALLPANGDTVNLVNLVPFETVERRVELSTEGWARDLRGLFEHAKERFGDVSWESEHEGDRVWGHKAVIYARAPKAFKDRYFITRPFARSPTSQRSHSPSPHFLPPLFPSRPTSPPSSYRHLSPALRSSSLSVNTVQSEGTIHAHREAVLRLTHGDTPELFRAQLEWLYTGEGFGDVVEWISAEDDSGLGGSIRDSLGRRGNIDERRDKLGQDLTYMWRSKLYADVRIHLDTPDTSDSASEDSDDSIDSLSSTAIFTAHKFILVSRSPYFASLLLNTSNFLGTGSNNDIHLPTPPFTPAALHFCLGWIYAGHLDFSNRTFDLTTAFQIHRAATYLQLETLVGEIEARVVHDFCHGLDRRKCTCQRCPFRAARVWRFASAPDVGAVELGRRAREYLTVAWGESWGKEVATAEKELRDGLVEDVVKRIRARNIAATIRSIALVRARMEKALRLKGREAGPWVDVLETMLERVSERVRILLLEQFAHIAEGREMWDLVSGKGFSADVLDGLGKELLAAVNTASGCIEGPRIYQALVSSILLKVDPNTLQTALPARGQGRQQIEAIKDGVVGHIRRRWMQVRDGGGFDDVENWALKEISDEIEISVDDLLAHIPSTPKKARFDTSTAARASPRPGLPRQPGHAGSSAAPTPAADGPSSRAARPSVSLPSARSTTPPDPSGLRRLRLSSSASSASVGSSRSVTRPAPRGNMTGPQARSPTAARQGSTVTIGAGRRPRAEGTASPTPTTRSTRTGTNLTPRSISGPPRQLLTKPTRPSPDRNAAGSPNAAPSVTSVRTTATARSTATTRTNATGTTTRAVPGRVDHAEAGPSRLRAVSASTTGSTRQPVAATSARPPVPGLKAKELASNGLEPPAVVRQRTASGATTASVRSQAASVVSKAPSVASKAPPVAGRVSSTTGASASRVNGTSASLATRSAANRTTSGASKAPSIAPSIASRTTITNRTTVTKTTPKATPVSSPKTPGRSAPTRPIPPVPALPSPTKSAPGGPAKPPAGKISVTGKPGATPKLRPSPSQSSLSTARTRLASTTSARSVSASSPPIPPPETKMKPRAIAFPAAPNVPSLLRSQGNVRSPSSSTDDAPEARTPRTSHLATHPEPKILRDGSDISDLANPASSTASSPTKFPPVAMTMPRPTRKISTSSTMSNGSGILRSHPASAFDPPKRVDLPPPPQLLPVEQMVLSDGVERFKGRGVELNVGVPCIVYLASKRARFKGSIKYIGHLANSRGAWVGLEVENLDRLGVPTLPSGTKSNTHYFHLTPPKYDTDAEDEARLARQRRIEAIRESLGKRAYGLGSGLGLGLGDGPMGLNGHGLGGAGKRSASPFVDFGVGGGGHPGYFGGERTRALFVRPSDIVFVMGAE